MLALLAAYDSEEEDEEYDASADDEDAPSTGLGYHLTAPPKVELLVNPPAPNAKKMAGGEIRSASSFATATGLRDVRKGALYSPAHGPPFLENRRPDPLQWPHIWRSPRNANGRREWALKHPHSDGSPGHTLVWSRFPEDTAEHRGHNRNGTRR